MRQGVVHLEAGGELAGVLPLGPAEQIHILAFAHAQHDNLRAGVHDGLEYAFHQVQTLLAGEAADHADHRDVGIHGQAELLLQQQLVLDLLIEGFGGVVLLDHRIGLRIVFHGVDAVQDAAEVIQAGAQ